MKKTKALQKGDYVLATKYTDGDPQDHWAIGFYAHTDERGRHYVVDNNGNQMRGNGFRRAQRIADPERGALILTGAKWIEHSGMSMWHWYRMPKASLQFLKSGTETTQPATAS